MKHCHFLLKEQHRIYSQTKAPSQKSAKWIWVLNLIHPCTPPLKVSCNQISKRFIAICRQRSIWYIFSIWLSMTSDDLWPPLKHNRNHLLTLAHPHTKNDIYPSFLPWDIVLKTNFQCLTPGDPRWPLTLTKSYTINLLTTMHLHTKYESYSSFLPWDIVITRFSVFAPQWPQMTFDLNQKR